MRQTFAACSSTLSSQSRSIACDSVIPRVNVSAMSFADVLHVAQPVVDQAERLRFHAASTPPQP